MEDADVGARAAAASGAPAGTLDDEKLKQMSWLMMGLGAALALGSFLPWATAGSASVSGVSAQLGFVTLAAGIMLGLYGYQGIREDDPVVRHHGWAITAVCFAILITSVSYSTVEDLGSLGGVVDVGAGLWIAVIASFAAIYPLVKLRKDGKARDRDADRREVSAMAAELAERTPAQASASSEGGHEAGWYDDPMARHERRYFDGAEWTEHVADGEATATDPLEQPAT